MKSVTTLDGTVVLGKIANLQQARVRDLQRPGLQEESCADGVPVRLFIAFHHANGHLDAERAMGGRGKSRCRDGRDRVTGAQLILGEQAGFLRRPGAARTSPDRQRRSTRRQTRSPTSSARGDVLTPAPASRHGQPPRAESPRRGAGTHGTLCERLRDQHRLVGAVGAGPR